MSTNLEIISWNVRDAINNPAIQESALATEPDIAIFPEAHAESDNLTDDTTRRFNNAGYRLLEKSYDDDDDRKDRHTLVVAVKPELIRDANPIRLVSRNAIRLTMHAGTEVMGVHLDDRQEQRRLVQATMAVEALNQTAIVAGDFNSMHSADSQARLLRMSGPVSRLLPARDPVPGEKTPKLQRLGSLSQRLTAMAKGTTMAMFVEAGFQDADSSHVATMKKGPIAAQLDRIMYRGNVSVAQPTVVEDADGLSDHKRIRATLRLG